MYYLLANDRVYQQYQWRLRTWDSLGKLIQDHVPRQHDCTGNGTSAKTSTQEHQIGTSGTVCYHLRPQPVSVSGEEIQESESRDRWPSTTGWTCCRRRGVPHSLSRHYESADRITGGGWLVLVTLFHEYKELGTFMLPWVMIKNNTIFCQWPWPKRSKRIVR